MHGSNTEDAGRMPAIGIWPMIPAGIDPLFGAPFEIGMSMYRHWLDAASRLIEAQSLYLRNLSACDDPFNILVCQTEFAEKSVAAGLDEFRRGVDTLTDTACEHLAVGGVLPQ